MNRKIALAALLASLSFLAIPAPAAERSGFGLTVLVDASPRPEYGMDGKIYVEAIKGREYQLRITNPLPCRVAVALSVDGLNTINAKHTNARSASKWVLEPYQTITISGWQINGSEARKFYFTGEKQSYGAFLGQTEDLGIIEAVFFKEKVRPLPPAPVWNEDRKDAGRGKREDAPRSQQAPVPEAQSRLESSSAGGAEKSQPRLSDDYAATGIGRKVDHDVEWVSLDLERRPSSVVRIRYEFRPQLVKLGVLPSPRPCPDPLDRREQARGFSGGYCPDPSAGRN
jgi:hypothetical protein